MSKLWWPSWYCGGLPAPYNCMRHLNVPFWTLFCMIFTPTGTGVHLNGPMLWPLLTEVVTTHGINIEHL